MYCNTPKIIICIQGVWRSLHLFINKNLNWIISLPNVKKVVGVTRNDLLY